MIYMIAAVVLLAIFTLTSAIAARNLNTNISTAIINTIAAVTPLLVAIPAISKKGIGTNKYGIFMAILTGVLIGFYGLAINKSFALNKIGVVTPIVYGGAIFLSAILSYFLLKEKLNFLEILGLVFVLAGLLIVIYARMQTSYET